MYLCIEILGESSFHKFLTQSGWSGRDYLFKYNRPTNSHMRAYRSVEEYRAERVDLHKSANIWPILANLLPAEQIDPEVFTSAGQPAPARVSEASHKKSRPRKDGKVLETGGECATGDASWCIPAEQDPINPTAPCP